MTRHTTTYRSSRRDATIEDARRSQATQDTIIIGGREVLKNSMPQQYRCGLCMVAGRELKLLRLERIKGTLGYRIVCPVCRFEHTSDDALVDVDFLRRLQRIEGFAATQMKAERHEAGIMAKQNGSEKALVARQGSPLVVPKQDGRDLQMRVKNFMPGMHVFEGMADQVAGALTQMAMAHELDPFNQELWAIPIKNKDAVVGFQMFTGIKGLRRAARVQSKYTEKSRRLEPEEITARGAHVCPACSGGGKCPACGGSGRWTNPKTKQQGKCFKCDGSGNCQRCEGRGKFDPENGEIIVVETQLWRHDTARDAERSGVPYEPVIGIGIWFKEDNVPQGKDQEWVATKRSAADALRAAYDLPFAYGEYASGPDYVEAEDDVVDADALRADGDVIDGEAVEVGEADFAEVTEPAEPHNVTEPAEVANPHNPPEPANPHKAAKQTKPAKASKPTEEWRANAADAVNALVGQLRARGKEPVLPDVSMELADYLADKTRPEIEALYRRLEKQVNALGAPAPPAPEEGPRPDEPGVGDYTQQELI